jgi:hypothetical protein
MARKIKTDVRFKSTAQLEKQVAKELAIPDPDKPKGFQNMMLKAIQEGKKDEDENTRRNG